MARTYRYNDYYEEYELRNHRGNSRNQLRSNLRDFMENYNSGSDLEDIWEDQEEELYERY